MPARSPLREALIILAMVCALCGAAGAGAVWAMLTTWRSLSAAPTEAMPPARIAQPAHGDGAAVGHPSQPETIDD